MRLGYASTFATQYYDRGPASRGLTFATNVGPHVQTTRWTYTCPTNKRAIIDSGLIHVMRGTVAAPVSTWGVEIDGVFLDASVAQISVVYMLTNGVGDRAQASIAQSAPMVAGEQMVAVSADASTGGVWQLIVTMWVTEFSIS